MTRKRIARLIVPALLISVSSAQAQSAPTIGARVLRQLHREFPCHAGSIHITTLAGLDRGDACVLTMALRHAIATGAATKVGVNPSDTAAIVSSMVAGMQWRDLNRPKRISDAYWTAAIDFSGKVPPLDGYIDQRTGRIRFNYGERYNYKK